MSQFVFPLQIWLSDLTAGLQTHSSSSGADYGALCRSALSGLNTAYERSGAAHAAVMLSLHPPVVCSRIIVYICHGSPRRSSSQAWIYVIICWHTSACPTLSRCIFGLFRVNLAQFVRSFSILSWVCCAPQLLVMARAVLAVSPSTCRSIALLQHKILMLEVPSATHSTTLSVCVRVALLARPTRSLLSIFTSGC